MRAPGSRSRAAALAVLGLIALASCLPSSRGAGASPAKIGAQKFVFGAPRPAREGEAAFEDTLPLLREPEDGNVVPGPHGLIALMKADRKHHPRVYLRDSGSQDSLHLLIDRYATKPRWSPVGERLACTVWKSRALPWTLCIVSLGQPDTLFPLPLVNSIRYRWSPDAKYLAVSATLEGGTASILYLVDAHSGLYRALDTLSVYSDFDIGWSPDSHLIAAAKPTRLADTEEVVEADIWVYDISGQRARVVPAAGHANVRPRWVDSRRLLFDREHPGAPDHIKSMVVELAPRTK